MEIVKTSEKFVQWMQVKKFAWTTIESYSTQLKSFLAYFKDVPRPIEISSQQIMDYLLTKIKSNTQRHAHSAIKLFYTNTVGQPLKFKHIPYAKKEKSFPIILSQEETQRLFDACKNNKHKTIMFVAYSTGVRVAELLAIKLSDIDRANGVIHIMHGKGAKQRQVTMKPELLKIIEIYYREYKPKLYLFEGQAGGKYTSSSINQFLKKYASIANIKKNVHIHLLRHLFATHSLEAGENLYITQKALGHASPKTTADIYYHISSNIIANAFSPIINIK
jgi:site-specific recombinase XerD